MSTFWATAEIGKDGKPRLSLGSDHNRARFADFLRKNVGVRIKIDPFTPESGKQRKFFEGAVVPLVAFYQENIDYRDYGDLKMVREWLKTEFNGKLITMGGRSVRLAKSTKGALNRGFLERVMDWMGEQGYQIEFLLPERYKDWHDRIYPSGGPKTYIEYLVKSGELRTPAELRTPGDKRDEEGVV